MFSSLPQPFNLLSRSSTARRRSSYRGFELVDPIEPRLLPAVSIYGTWTLTIEPPDVPPEGDPGPYTLVIHQTGTLRKSGKVHLSGNATATVQLPGEGNVFAQKVKVNKAQTTAKGKFNSPPLKGSFQAEIDEIKSEIRATIKFLDKSVKLSEDFKLKGSI